MHTTTARSHGSAHLSGPERQWLRRADAFSRGTPATPAVTSPMKLDRQKLELIDRLVRRDRTAVSTALLAIAGIWAGESSRRAVLSRIAESACWAQAEGAVTARRAEQISRHVKRALGRTGQSVMA